jgi:methyltransferase (TIGR00027 family)
MGELIEHVSDTAFWVAYYRWVETRRKDALFHDPLAIKLCGERGAKLARHMGIERAMAWSMALRTWIIDRYIREAIDGGVDMVINLGAGLDTRPYRLDLSPDFQWVEVDFLHVVDYKNKVLADDEPRCQLERIACDLSIDAERETLLARLNGRAEHILVLTEGVVPYLSNGEAGKLARDLEARNHIDFWLTDYFSPFFHRLSAHGGIRKRLEKNAPFRFNPGPEPIDWPAFFANAGWQVADIRFSGEESIKIGRKLPAGWLAQLFIRFMPEEKLRPFKRMNGYVLLKKGHEVVSI